MVLHDAGLHFRIAQVQLAKHLVAGLDVLQDFCPFIRGQWLGLVPNKGRNLGHAHVVHEQSRNEAVEHLALNASLFEIVLVQLRVQGDARDSAVEGVVFKGVLGVHPLEQGLDPVDVLEQVLGQDHEIDPEPVEDHRNRLIQELLEPPCERLPENVGYLAFLEILVRKHQVQLVADVLDVYGVVVAGDEDQSLFDQLGQFLHLFVAQPSADLVIGQNPDNVLLELEDVQGWPVLVETPQNVGIDLVVFFVQAVWYFCFGYDSHILITSRKSSPHWFWSASAPPWGARP